MFLFLPQVFLYVSTCGNYTWHKWPENLVLFSADSKQVMSRCASVVSNITAPVMSHHWTCFWCVATSQWPNSFSSLWYCLRFKPVTFVHYTLLSSKIAQRLYIISNITCSNIGSSMFLLNNYLTVLCVISSQVLSYLRHYQMS